jgi:regulator of nonsense transcripts 1
MERLVERPLPKKFPVSLLNLQYRMPRAIGEFASNTFYEGKLDHSKDELAAPRPFPWPMPNPDFPMFFWDVESRQKWEKSDWSLVNSAESEVVRSIVAKLCDSGAVEQSDIVVLSPYRGQVDHIAAVLKEDHHTDVLVETIDAFQGREADWIIVSCVRANAVQSIGFVNERRMNVALTRSKKALIVVGNMKTLGAQSTWWKSLDYCHRNTAVVGGTIENLEAREIPPNPDAKKEALPNGADA